LRDAQLREITGFAASLAGLQVLRKIGGLSKRKNWPEAKTRHWRQNIFPQTSFHIVRPSEEIKTTSTTVMLVLAIERLTGTH
jgi:hypothetical protein